jgi:hypothetical protein
MTGFRVLGLVFRFESEITVVVSRAMRTCETFFACMCQCL